MTLVHNINCNNNNNNNVTHHAAVAVGSLLLRAAPVTTGSHRLVYGDQPGCRCRSGTGEVGAHFWLLTLGPARVYRGSLLITLMELTSRIARPIGRDVSDAWEKTRSHFLFLYMEEWLQDARTGISSICPQFLITDSLHRAQKRSIPRF